MQASISDFPCQEEFIFYLEAMVLYGMNWDNFLEEVVIMNKVLPSCQAAGSYLAVRDI
jgi:hypothetical protein